MNRPFFSIVIPTKNRPGLLRDAISSVLLQNFDDYELIVSDNFNDERTVNVVNEFKNNKHLNYIRTEKELNMHDHWEFATKKVKGTYTLILTDRSFLRQGSLRDIYNSISESKKDVLVCFWNYGYYDEKSKILLGEKEQSGIKFLKSEDLAKDFSRTLNGRYLPRPHVGCYRFDLAQKIRQNIGRLYLPLCPDYTSSLLFLAYSDFVMYIPRPLFFFQGETVSNLTKERGNPWPYMHSLGMKDLYRFVPIKTPIGSSLVFNDLLTIRNLVGGNLKDIDIDWVLYFVLCYEELIGRMTTSWADKEVQLEFLGEWKKTLSNFDKKMQAEVWRKIRWRYKRILKAYLRSSFLGDFLARIKRFLLRKPTLHYPNALAAGGFSNYVESSSKEVFKCGNREKII